MPAIRYTETAASDLESISDSLALADPTAAGHFLASVRLHCRQLARVAGMGVACPEEGEGVRSFLVGHHAIYYRRSEEGACVLRVLPKTGAKRGA